MQSASPRLSQLSWIQTAGSSYSTHTHPLSEPNAMSSTVPDGDVVATWNVPLHDKVHQIEFEHGTTTGKRVIRVDKKEILRRDWMFKLVGKETFNIGDMKCTINVEALGTFAYEYSLDVNGKGFNKFKEEQNKRLHSWETRIGGADWRVVLDKDTMEVWANGVNIVTAGEFVDNGTVTHFELGTHPCKIVAESSGKRKTGVVHTLYVDGELVKSASEAAGSSKK